MEDFIIAEDGAIMHCNKIVVWRDCPDHNECCYFECSECGIESTKDCEE